jgi:hypothetical protein
MKKILILLLLCASQTGCLAVAVVEGVTDVAIAVVTAPIKVGVAVVDAVSGDDDDDSKTREPLSKSFGSRLKKPQIIRFR